MSVTILEFAKSFVAGRVSACVFSEAYMELWKIERDSNLLQKDSGVLNECLSNIFCAADMYNSDDSREEYELDGEKLKSEVASLVRKIKSDL